MFAGRYNDGENLSGPEKFAKRIFEKYSNIRNGSPGPLFIQYFFDGRKYGIKKKLFGRDKEIKGNKTVITLGLFRIYGAIKACRPDVIHIVTFERFAVIIFLYKMFNKITVIYTSHGIIQHENRLKKNSFFYKLKDNISEWLMLKFSGKIIYPSSKAKDIAGEYYSINESKEAVIPNGIDDFFFRTPKNAPQVTGSALKAVYIYRNEFNNPGLEFLQKFVKTAKIKIELFIISRKRIDINASREVIVNFSPLMSAKELSEFYIDKDIFISLNSYDTFSISTAEAMAAGLIPIVTTQTGISERIVNGMNGYKVSYGDIPALEKVFSEIMELNTGDINRIKLKASGTCMELKWENTCQKYAVIYDHPEEIYVI
jgi:glycosyltransferase involved in cell wall biosynthesis